MVSCRRFPTVPADRAALCHPLRSCTITCIESAGRPTTNETRFDSPEEIRVHRCAARLCDSRRAHGPFGTIRRAPSWIFTHRHGGWRPRRSTVLHRKRSHALLVLAIQKLTRNASHSRFLHTQVFSDRADVLHRDSAVHAAARVRAELLGPERDQLLGSQRDQVVVHPPHRPLYSWVSSGNHRLRRARRLVHRRRDDVLPGIPASHEVHKIDTFQLCLPGAQSFALEALEPDLLSYFHRLISGRSAVPGIELFIPELLRPAARVRHRHTYLL